MKPVRLSRWNRVLTCFVLWNLLFSMIPTNLVVAQSAQSDYASLEPTIPLDANSLNLTINKDSQGQDMKDEEGMNGN